MAGRKFEGGPEFSKWLKKLRDVQGRGVILGKLDDFILGNQCDLWPVGEKVYEMRITASGSDCVFPTRNLPAYMCSCGLEPERRRTKDVAKAKRLYRANWGENRWQKQKSKYEPYDAAEFLDTAEDVEAYIGEALRSGDKRRIKRFAIATIKRASA